MAYFVFFRNLLEERILDLVLFLLMLNNIRSMLVIIFFLAFGYLGAGVAFCVYASATSS